MPFGIKNNGEGTSDQQSIKQEEGEETTDLKGSEDENFLRTQELINKIFRGELEFNEGDSLDKLMSQDDVFTTRERRISF